MERDRKKNTHICSTDARTYKYITEQTKINNFMQTCVRRIIEKYGIPDTKTTPAEDHTKPMQTYKVYQRAKQPTVTSWMEKQSTIHMAKQTNLAREIHRQTQPRMKQIKETWEKHGMK